MTWHLHCNSPKTSLKQYRAAITGLVSPAMAGPMFTLFHRHFSNNLPDLVVGVAESLAVDYGMVNAYALMSVVESHSQTN